MKEEELRDLIGLRELVMLELENIKKYASKTQISRLNVKTVNPDKISRCIYGQMTTSCFSEEARSLVKKCTVPYTSILDEERLPLDILSPRLSFNIMMRDFTPLEQYIVMFENKIPDIIKFLKGKKDTIVV